MNGDDQIIAQSEKREESVRRLCDALAECQQSDLTDDEILGVLRAHLIGDDGILLGTLVDQLNDGEASTVIRIIYGGLSAGSTLSFVASRTPGQIDALCDDAAISHSNVTLTPEGGKHRVSIEKLQ